MTKQESNRLAVELQALLKVLQWQVDEMATIAKEQEAEDICQDCKAVGRMEFKEKIIVLKDLAESMEALIDMRQAEATERAKKNEIIFEQ